MQTEVTLNHAIMSAIDHLFLVSVNTYYASVIILSYSDRILPIYGTDKEETDGQVESRMPGYSGKTQTFIRNSVDILGRTSGVMATLMFILGFGREENRQDRDEHILIDMIGQNQARKRAFEKVRNYLSLLCNEVFRI